MDFESQYYWTYVNMNMSHEFSTTWIANSKMLQNRTMVSQILNKYFLATGKNTSIGHYDHQLALILRHHEAYFSSHFNLLTT